MPPYGRCAFSCAGRHTWNFLSKVNINNRGKERKGGTVERNRGREDGGKDGRAERRRKGGREGEEGGIEKGAHPNF